MSYKDLYNKMNIIKNKTSKHRRYNKIDYKKDFAIMYITSKGKTYECLLDKDIAELIQPLGKWTLNSSGYVHYYNGKADLAIVLHRFIMELDNSNIIVDHINRNRLDNRRCNLRLLDIATNNYNRTPNKLNIKNICKLSNGDYYCYITKDKITYNKYFKNLDKAKEWAKDMERKLYGLQRTVH